MLAARGEPVKARLEVSQRHRATCGRVCALLWQAPSCRADLVRGLKLSTPGQGTRPTKIAFCTRKAGCPDTYLTGRIMESFRGLAAMPGDLKPAWGTARAPRDRCRTLHCPTPAPPQNSTDFGQRIREKPVV